MLNSKTTRIAKLIQLPFENNEIPEMIKEDMEMKFRALESNKLEYYNNDEILESNRGFKSIHQSGFSNKRPQISKIKLNKIEMKMLKQNICNEKLISQIYSSLSHDLHKQKNSSNLNIDTSEKELIKNLETWETKNKLTKKYKSPPNSPLRKRYKTIDNSLENVITMMSPKRTPKQLMSKLSIQPSQTWKKFKNLVSEIKKFEIIDPEKALESKKTADAYEKELNNRESELLKNEGVMSKKIHSLRLENSKISNKIMHIKAIFEQITGQGIEKSSDLPSKTGSFQKQVFAPRMAINQFNHEDDSPKIKPLITRSKEKKNSQIIKSNAPDSSSKLKLRRASYLIIKANSDKMNQSKSSNSKPNKNISLVDLNQTKQEYFELLKCLRNNQNLLSEEEVRYSLVRKELKEISKKRIKFFKLILARGQDFKEDGLTWILIKLFEIEGKLKEDELKQYFPPYLDAINCEFLLQRALIEIKCSELQAIQKSILDIYRSKVPTKKQIVLDGRQVKTESFESHFQSSYNSNDKSFIQLNSNAFQESPLTKKLNHSLRSEVRFIGDSGYYLNKSSRHAHNNFYEKLYASSKKVINQIVMKGKWPNIERSIVNILQNKETQNINISEEDEDFEIHSDFKLFENNTEVFNFKNRSEFVFEFQKVENQLIDSEKKLRKLIADEKDRIFREVEGTTSKMKFKSSFESILKGLFGVDECRIMLLEKRKRLNRVQAHKEIP